MRRKKWNNARPYNLNRDDDVIGPKLDLLDEVLPVESAIVFGDMYIVEGAYSEYCVRSASRVALVDSFETPGFLQRRLDHPSLDFRKGDFSDPSFMQSVRGGFELGVAYEVLLHQAPLLSALHLMLERVTNTFVVAQPMLRERDTPNSLIYLPGMPGTNLHPLSDPDRPKMFDPEVVKQGKWIWGMTPSFLVSALAGEGFVVTDQRVLCDMPNTSWMQWGCIAERNRELGAHWSDFSIPPGLYGPKGETLGGSST